MDKPAIDLAPGTVFADRYRITGLLGRGGMGAVYHASDLYLAEDVALKLLLVDLETNPALALRFRQEVKLSRRINHPNVIRVHDIGEHAGFLFMTMELVRGKTLRALLNSHRTGMPQQQALSIGRAVAEGLRSAHAASVIHRDIKPSNVLIDDSGRVVLADFGIARCLEEDLDLTHGLLGTRSYMAPEQATNGSIDARTDIYALGLVLYEMLVGERPAGAPAEVASRLDRASSPVAPALAKVLLKCLSLDPSGRPSGVSEVLDAMGEGSDGPSDLSGSAPTVAESNVPRAGLALAAPAQPALQPKLAILPFRYRGPPEQEYLGEVLTDELVDALSRTRGLFVLGSGATARFRDDRDPITLGKELRIQAVIDGAIQAGGDRVRVSVRLLDAGTGVQRWVQQSEGSLSDVFAFQESVVRRIAEELRIELHTMAHAHTTPTQALDRYVEARREMRVFDFGASSHAVELLDGALSLSPSFAPALAARAVAAVRTWFLNLGHDGNDWEKVASDAVARAVAEAPEIAESHLALAIFETQRGKYKTAVTALARALEIAPTCAPAHEYIGTLLAEAGHLHKGLERLKLAVELDPSRLACWGTMARVYTILDDPSGFEEVMTRLEPLERPDRVSIALSERIRNAAWNRDLDGLRAIVERSDRLDSHPTGRLVLLYGKALLGQVVPEELPPRFAQFIEMAKSPRMQSLGLQIEAEAFAFLGCNQLALELISRAARSVLVDIAWLDRCPLFVELRAAPAFQEAQATVRARASAIWAP